MRPIKTPWYAYLKYDLGGKKEIYYTCELSNDIV